DGKGSNLHRVWDSGMLNTRGLHDDEYHARLALLPLVVPDRPALPPPAPQWAEQSCSIALSDGFYPARPRVAAVYVQRCARMAEGHPGRAGVDLARLLHAARVAAQP